MQVMLMRLMSKGEYLIVPKGTKFKGSGKLGLSTSRFQFLIKFHCKKVLLLLIQGCIPFQVGNSHNFVPFGQSQLSQIMIMTFTPRLEFLKPYDTLQFKNTIKGVKLISL